MRVSRETARKNRQNVVRTAAEQFRTHGYDGIGIASLMKAAGMTQGGFYKQFENKEALECEATELALNDNFELWAKTIEEKSDPVAALKAWYLSAQHLSTVSRGCAYATLAAEATRQRPALQARFSRAVTQQVEHLAEAIGESPESRTEAIQAMSQMIGALILARAVDDEDLQHEILTACQKPCAPKP
ncbi:TetR/AcrR family transcriptional regulator [Phaeobacter sp. B1627]|uniref:TetR/AcrR family transcriptional regulator n=1 Tax=Phaeobacter sp. B1627 TaxID=2583809 RepID=UPI001118E29C|nr:TetR/AcrR family transcriptional regulator [Phaeobacter sp. B1627]TNJ38821.1 TetR/AcrR family transcriptional regulator [Phaeobacter sp. B1627]